MLLALLPWIARAQQPDGLDAAVETARQGWLQHDVGRLLGATDTVRLTLPEVAQALSVRPGQAGRLLERYLKAADEQSLELKSLRRMAPDHAYAELERRYVVRGTEETRVETVYLFFRLAEGEWRLREVRVAY